MKLIVVYRDGRQREIDLPPDATVTLGERLNRLTNGSIEHWFDRDGYYDGWGAMINQNTAELVNTPADMAAELRTQIKQWQRDCAELDQGIQPSRLELRASSLFCDCLALLGGGGRLAALLADPSVKETPSGDAR